MINKNKKIIIIFLNLFIIFISLSISVNGYADQKQKLPRSFGPIYLGMSVEEFKKIVNKEPLRCATCIEDKLQASLYIDSKRAKIARTNPVMLKDAYIKFQPRELQPEMIACFFYKGVLYGIVMTDVRGVLESVKNRYVKALDKPTAVDVWDAGVSQLRWDKGSTSLRVVYTIKERGVDYLEISYTDLKIVSQIPKSKE